MKTVGYAMYYFTSSQHVLSQRTHASAIGKPGNRACPWSGVGGKGNRDTQSAGKSPAAEWPLERAGLALATQLSLG